jgi:hypothetical protein
VKWITTIEPAPWRIAGFNLGPLRFGHCVILERWGLDSLDDETALHYFLGVCSQSYSQALIWLESAADKPQSSFKDFNGHRKEAFQYLHENLGLPTAFHGKNSGETAGTPFLQGLRLTGITKLGYSPHEIMESRFGQLVWDVMSLKESLGEIRIMDEYLAGQLEKLKEMNA